MQTGMTQHVMHGQYPSHAAGTGAGPIQISGHQQRFENATNSGGPFPTADPSYRMYAQGWQNPQLNQQPGWHPAYSVADNSPMHANAPQHAMGPFQAAPSSWHQPSNTHVAPPSWPAERASSHNSAGPGQAAAIHAAAQVLVNRSPRHGVLMHAEKHIGVPSDKEAGDSALPQAELLPDSPQASSGLRVLIKGGQKMWQASIEEQISDSKDAPSLLCPVVLPPSPKADSHDTASPQQEATAPAAASSPRAVSQPSASDEASAPTEWKLLSSNGRNANDEVKGGLDSIRPGVTVCVGLAQSQTGGPRRLSGHSSNIAAPLIHTGQAIMQGAFRSMSGESHPGLVQAGPPPGSHTTSPHSALHMPHGHMGVSSSSHNGHTWSEYRYVSSLPTAGATGHSAVHGSGSPHAQMQHAQNMQPSYPVQHSALDAERHSFADPHGGLVHNQWAQPSHSIAPRQASWQQAGSPQYGQMYGMGAYSATPAAAYAPGYAAAIAAASYQSNQDAVGEGGPPGMQLGYTPQSISHNSHAFQPHLFQSAHMPQRIVTNGTVDSQASTPAFFSHSDVHTH